MNLQEQAFMALYLQSFNACQSALGAGYSESVARKCAWAWVGVTGCPPDKRHLRDAIHKEVDRRFKIEEINADWVLKRAKLLADFNISKFIKLEDDKAVYDFSSATTDDWYCIEEYTTEISFQKAASGDLIPVEKFRIKTVSKIAALKLIGDHVNVQAFRESAEATSDSMAEMFCKLIDKLPG